MIEDIENNMGRVQKLLEDYPQLEGSDRDLILAYMNRYHDLREHLGEKYDMFVKIWRECMPSPESLTRARRKVVENKPKDDYTENEQERVKRWAVSY